MEKITYSIIIAIAMYYFLFIMWIFYFFTKLKCGLTSIRYKIYEIKEYIAMYESLRKEEEKEKEEESLFYLGLVGLITEEYVYIEYSLKKYRKEIEEMNERISRFSKIEKSVLSLYFMIFNVDVVHLLIQGAISLNDLTFEVNTLINKRNEMVSFINETFNQQDKS